MSKKYIDVMDTTFRDGLESILNNHVSMEDLLPAVAFASDIGINHFEFGGYGNFSSLCLNLHQDPFEMMLRFREAAGPEANLQVLAHGINTVMHESASRELINLFAKLFAKYETTTVRNYDALNDIRNLEFSGSVIKHHGMLHEVTVTLMDLPPGAVGAHDVEFYKKKIIEILESGIEFDSIAFKDASGTSNPAKIYETIKMARELLGEDMHIRLHTHESAGVSIAAYLAALEAGVDGIDLAASPLSGGASQPDMLTLLLATKGMDYNLNDLEPHKVLKYEEFLKEQLKDYLIPTEAKEVNPFIQYAPMPGNEFNTHLRMIQKNGNLKIFDNVIKSMREVIERGGFGTSVAPLSQYYWEQALTNVQCGPWQQIVPGYGKMVLGYFGRTPIVPDPEIVTLASQKLNLEPTVKDPLKFADADEKKSINYWKSILEKEAIEISDESIFIAATCKKEAIAYLKGEPIHPEKKSEEPIEKRVPERYTVTVNGEKYSVEVAPEDNIIESVSINDAYK